MEWPCPPPGPSTRDYPARPPAHAGKAPFPVDRTVDRAARRDRPSRWPSESAVLESSRKACVSHRNDAAVDQAPTSMSPDGTGVDPLRLGTDRRHRKFAG